MHRNVQRTAPLRLTDQRIVPRLRRGERLIIRPRALHEMEAVFQAGLIAREEEAPGVRFVLRLGGVVGVEFAAVRDPVADYAGHFDGVGVGAGVHFADVGAEGALELGDAAVAEGVVELVLGFVWEFSNRGS